MITLRDIIYLSILKVFTQKKKKNNFGKKTTIPKLTRVPLHGNKCLTCKSKF